MSIQSRSSADAFYTSPEFDRQLEALAELLYPEIRKYYESPQGQAEFRAWLAQRQREAKSA